MSKAQLEKILSLQNSNIQKNVQIVSKEDLGQDFLIRLDIEKFNRKSLIPRIAYSQANSEDRTLPRVVVCPHIQGCLKALPDIIEYALPLYEKPKVEYYIHGLNFEYCLKPNTKLVFDVKDRRKPRPSGRGLAVNSFLLGY